MATCTLADGRAVTTNAATYASNSFTPAANDLLVVFAIVSGDAGTTATMTDSQSLGWTKIATGLFATSANSIVAWVSNGFTANSAMTVTAGTGGGNATGCVLFTYRVASMVRTGARGAVRQSATNPNQTTTVAAPTVGLATVLTGNPTLLVLGNSTSPAGLTPPASWTETAAIGDLGYSTPPTGGETAFRDSGFTGTTVTWGSNSASAWGTLGVELDTTTPKAPPPWQQRWDYRARYRTR